MANLSSASVTSSCVMRFISARTVRAVEEALHPGFPADAGAILLVETEGVREGLDGESERIAALCRAAGATTTRLAENASQREAFWAGRKGARSVLGRLRPNYYVHDGVVPRTRIAEALEAIEEIASRHELPVATYLHAGDGNIHPNILFDAAVLDMEFDAEHPRDHHRGHPPLHREDDRLEPRRCGTFHVSLPDADATDYVVIDAEGDIFGLLVDIDVKISLRTKIKCL